MSKQKHIEHTYFSYLPWEEITAQLNVDNLKEGSTNLKFDRDGTTMVHETQEQNRKSFQLIWILNFYHCSTFLVYISRTNKNLNKWMTQVNQPHNNVHCRNNQINFLNTIIYIQKRKRPMIKERTEGVDILGNTFFLNR